MGLERGSSAESGLGAWGTDLSGACCGDGTGEGQHASPSLTPRCVRGGTLIAPWIPWLEPRSRWQLARTLDKGQPQLPGRLRGTRAAFVA